MRRQKYTEGNYSIAGHNAVGMNGYDVVMSGPRGDLWQVGHNSFECFVMLPSGDEKRYRFNQKKLNYWIKSLEIPTSRKDQLKWANNPNKRLQNLKKGQESTSESAIDPRASYDRQLSF